MIALPSATEYDCDLAWKAIQKKGFLKGDQNLAEFFMTISGTIISRRVNGHLQVQVLPSKSEDTDLIAALIKGNTKAKVYRCDDAAEDKCLNLCNDKYDGRKATHVMSGW